MLNWEYISRSEKNPLIKVMNLSFGNKWPYNVDYGPLCLCLFLILIIFILKRNHARVKNQNLHIYINSSWCSPSPEVYGSSKHFKFQKKRRNWVLCKRRERCICAVYPLGNAMVSQNSGSVFPLPQMDEHNNPTIPLAGHPCLGIHEQLTSVN